MTLKKSQILCEPSFSHLESGGENDFSLPPSRRGREQKAQGNCSRTESVALLFAPHVISFSLHYKPVSSLLRVADGAVEAQTGPVFAHSHS